MLCLCLGASALLKQADEMTLKYSLVRLLFCLAHTAVAYAIMFSRMLAAAGVIVDMIQRQLQCSRLLRNFLVHTRMLAK